MEIVNHIVNHLLLHQAREVGNLPVEQGLVLGACIPSLVLH
jgi:hypothetical protein